MNDLSVSDRTEWQSVLDAASLKLVELTITHCERKTTWLIEQENIILQSHPFTPIEIQERDNFETKLRKELVTVKMRKLARDNVNYDLEKFRMNTETRHEHTLTLKTYSPPATHTASTNNETQVENNVQSVVNLSKITLSSNEYRLLSKGLNFCPISGNCDEFQVFRDLDYFARNLRLRENFADRPQATGDLIMPGRSGGWTPGKGRDRCLDLYIDAVQREIMQQFRQKRPGRQNLNLHERNALKSLSLRTDIVIKPADKGGAIVIMNSDDYLAEGLRQLNDPKFYKHLTCDPTSHHTTIVTEALSTLVRQNKITSKVQAGLKQTQPTTGRFYMLPKIHKTGNPGRPIISGNGTLTEPLSSFVDNLIKHIPPTFPSYIKDTGHFLREVARVTIPDGSFLVTLDVSSLYTNIPHDDGVGTLLSAYASNRRMDTPEVDVVATLSRLVLELNSFEFNNSHYIQISGTAMGTKMAPNYANIFMGALESQFIEASPLKPIFYKRFIDDIFLIWTHTEEQLFIFIERFNRAHPNIKFTHEYSRTSINFLDVTLSVEGNKLQTRLYRKPTDSQKYLHYHSSHPRHCKNSIPYSQAHRFRRICSEKQEFERNVADLRGVLLQQRYPAGVIEDAIDKARALDREDILTGHSKVTSDHRQTNLVMTYNNNAPNVNKVLSKHFNIIEQSQRLKQIIPSPPRVVYRRSKNLRDTLVHSRTTRAQSSGCSPCGKPQCKVCPHMVTTDTARSTKSNFSMKIYGDLRCCSPNVVYLLECQVCKMQYVGQTVRAFNERFNNHRSHSTKVPSLPLSKHLTLPDHSFDKLSVTLLQSGFKSNLERELKEAHLIYKFDAVKCGINESPGIPSCVQLL
ncbi:unnamed protein product [Ixodes pacificus]